MDHDDLNAQSLDPGPIDDNPLSTKGDRSAMDADSANNAELREAKHFWGDLFTADKQCSPTLKLLLQSIAVYILAAFYKAVGGNYDLLFLDTPANSIAFIYQQLGCLHSLQPSSDSNPNSAPEIPALKPAGFVIWQTKQLLLDPEEHVSFIQQALQKFDLIDPQTNAPYPKTLPADCFPAQPDPDTVKWYENVSQKMQPQDERAAYIADRSKASYKRRATPTVEAADSSADDKPGAVRSSVGDPLRGHSQRSARSNRSTRAIPRPVQVIHDSQRAAASPMLHVRQTHLDMPAHRMKRRSWHAESEQDGDSDEIEHLELASTRRSLARQHSRGSLSSTDLDHPNRTHAQPQHGRRKSLQSRDSESYGSSRPVSLRRESTKGTGQTGSQSLRQSRAQSPVYRSRRRMSHDKPVSPTDYFHTYPASPQRPNMPYHAKHTSRTSHVSSSPTNGHNSTPLRHKGFSPSTDASFAARIAHMQDGEYGINDHDVDQVADNTYIGDDYHQPRRDRPRIQTRNESGRLYSREEEYEPRYSPGPRSARRYADEDRDYTVRSAHSVRSRSSEGRAAAQDRRPWERNRASADREYDRDDDRIARDDREARRHTTRRARFADYSGPSGGSTTGVDGRTYPDWS